MYLALEGSFLACQLLSVVLLREGNNYVLLVAGLAADQLILEARDECAGAQSQLVMLCLAALERNAVYKALEVDINGIVLLSLALYGLGAGVALSHAVQLCLNVSLQNLNGLLLNLNALVLAELNFRLNRYLGDDGQAALFCRVAQINVCTADRLDAGLLNSHFHSVRVNDIESFFKEHAFAVQLLDHLARCLALAEARNGDVLAGLLECLVLSCFKLSLGDLDSQSNDAVLLLFSVFQFHVANLLTYFRLYLNHSTRLF